MCGPCPVFFFFSSEPHGSTSSVPRSKRFTPTFLANIKDLLVTLVLGITCDRPYLKDKARILSLDVAFFLRDLFTYMDRGDAMELVASVFG